MFNELINFYKIGMDLGLSKKEINKIFLHSNEHSLLYKLIIILIIIVISFFAVIFIAAIIRWATYPSGTLYSSVTNDDFNKKDEIKHRFWKKIRSRLFQY